MYFAQGSIRYIIFSFILINFKTVQSLTSSGRRKEERGEEKTLGG